MSLEQRAMPELHAYVLRRVVDLVKPGACILDIAAGTGALTKAMVGRGFHVVANDIDRSGWGLPDVPLMQVDLNGPFAVEFARLGVQPDFIVAVEVIEHLENPRNFLRQCRELVGTARVLVTTPNINTTQGRLGFVRHGRLPYFNEHEYSPCGHITILPYWLLKKHAEAAGFSRVKLEFSGTVAAPAGLRRWGKAALGAIAAAATRETVDRELNGGATVAILE